MNKTLVLQYTHANINQPTTNSQQKKQWKILKNSAIQKVWQHMQESLSDV